MPSKANTGQHHNGNNNGSSSSSSSSSGHPPSSNKHTCRKCSAPWHPGHQHKPRQPAALNTSQVQTSTSQQPASASLLPSSSSPSPAPSLAPPPFGTNQPFTNALDTTAKKEFMEALRHAWEIQGNIELAAINLNSLLYPGNTSNSAMNAPSPVVTLEAIHVKGLNTDDDDNVDNCQDKVEPLITAPILLNHQHATAFIDSDDMEITLDDRSTTHITHCVAHVYIDCGSCKLFHHFFIMSLQGEHEILFGKDIM
ncbi:hypothetical protein QOT17_018827 [Balamuthia mandrillaris]